MILGIGGTGLVFVLRRLTAEGAESKHQVRDIPVIFQVLHAFGFRFKMADLFAKDRVDIHDDAGDLDLDAAALAKGGFFDPP